MVINTYYHTQNFTYISVICFNNGLKTYVSPIRCWNVSHTSNASIFNSYSYKVKLKMNRQIVVQLVCRWTAVYLFIFFGCGKWGPVAVCGWRR